MKELTREWTRFAEEDYSAVVQLFIEGKNPPYGIVCFHCQQCVEKYMKAFLTEHGIEFEKTHRLTPLLDLCLPIHPEWDLHRDALKVLTNFAVISRYPYEVEVNRKITQNAVDIAIEMREIVRTALGM